MKPAIDVIGYESCTGCFGCYNSCPFNAIEMQLDNYGFYIPVINRDKCTDCGICQKHCPVISRKNNNTTKPRFYAAITTDNKSLMNSSSGGIFGELAKSVLKEDGIVYGAGWDDNLKLVHKAVSDEAEITSIQGSKYIQSNMKKVYLDVVSNAKEGKKILFCGTPCQVAALNTFIMDQKDIKDRITTCDLVCHGVGSTLFMKKYLSYLILKYGSEISSISFRSKKTGWSDYSMEILFKNGKRYIKSHRFDPFMIIYLKNLCLRQSCYQCPFNRIPRYGDITLGDLWGATKGVYNHYGVSLVITNNTHGERIIRRLIDKKVIIAKEYPRDLAINSNPRIASGNYKIPPQRDLFFSDLTTKSFDELLDIYVSRRNLIYHALRYAKYMKFKLHQYYKKYVWKGFD